MLVGSKTKSNAKSNIKVKKKCSRELGIDSDSGIHLLCPPKTHTSPPIRTYIRISRKPPTPWSIANRVFFDKASPSTVSLMPSFSAAYISSTASYSSQIACPGCLSSCPVISSHSINSGMDVQFGIRQRRKGVLSLGKEGSVCRWRVKKGVKTRPVVQSNAKSNIELTVKSNTESNALVSSEWKEMP